MKNKKGFTLIELLAVIVILAIIALIATPIVMNVIENSRKGAAERGAENHLDAIETAIMETRMDGEMLSDGTYTLGTLEAEIGTLEVSGQKATAASIIVKDGQVLDGSTLTVNGYVVNIVDGAGKVGDFGTVTNDMATQTAIMYDPVADDTCEEGSTCYLWFVFSGNEKDYAYVSLIMDSNLGDLVAWGNEGDSTPTIAQAKLEEETKDWTVLASLPTAQQVANVVNNTTWTPNSDSALSFGPYSWLGESLSSANPPYGYWTSTAKDSSTAWAVNKNSMGNPPVYLDTNSGIRPVILVAKDKLK